MGESEESMVDGSKNRGVGTDSLPFYPPIPFRIASIRPSTAERK